MIELLIGIFFTVCIALLWGTLGYDQMRERHDPLPSVVQNVASDSLVAEAFRLPLLEVEGCPAFGEYGGTNGMKVGCVGKRSTHCTLYVKAEPDIVALCKIYRIGKATVELIDAGCDS